MFALHLSAGPYLKIIKVQENLQVRKLWAPEDQGSTHWREKENI